MRPVDISVWSSTWPGHTSPSHSAPSPEILLSLSGHQAGELPLLGAAVDADGPHPIWSTKWFSWALSEGGAAQPPAHQVVAALEIVKCQKKYILKVKICQESLKKNVKNKAWTINVSNKPGSYSWEHFHRHIFHHHLAFHHLACHHLVFFHLHRKDCWGSQIEEKTLKDQQSSKQQQKSSWLFHYFFF